MTNQYDEWELGSDGKYRRVVVVASSDGTAADSLKEGTPETGQSLGAGGTHTLGWLSSIRKAVTDRLPAALAAGGGLKVEGVAGGIAQNIIGTKTNNNAAPDAGQLGVLPGIANASAPTLTEGYSVKSSMDLSGNQRMTLGTRIYGESQSLDRVLTAGQYLVGQAAAVATTPIKSGAGVMAGFIIPTLVAGGTVKIYDSTTGSGTVLMDTYTVPATITSDLPIFIPWPAGFNTGVTVVTTGTAMVVDVLYL